MKVLSDKKDYVMKMSLKNDVTKHSRARITAAGRTEQVGITEEHFLGQPGKQTPFQTKNKEIRKNNEVYGEY